jgi:2-polyprenyl-6-methoxyphenol hydroxylase-like FAD-dependent oxidoreductase
MGAGIGLQPVGLRVLERMGLLEQVVAHGARLDSLLARTVKGQIVLDLRYASFDRRLFGVGLLREVLHRELTGAVIGENSVALRYGESVAGACVAETASANAADRASRVPIAAAPEAATNGSARFCVSRRRAAQPPARTWSSRTGGWRAPTT